MKANIEIKPNTEYTEVEGLGSRARPATELPLSLKQIYPTVKTSSEPSRRRCGGFSSAAVSPFSKRSASGHSITESLDWEI